VAPLAALSYKLHSQLAASHNGRATWGYSHSTGISFTQDNDEAVCGSGEDWLESGTSRAQLANDNRLGEDGGVGPDWLRRTKEGTMEVISRDGKTAQIDPLRFCRWMLARCQERGVQVHYPARALSVSQEQGVLNGVCISQDGAETECKTTSIPQAFLQLIIVYSTMYTASYHQRRMVASRLHHSVPYRNDSSTDFVSRRPFSTHSQPTLQGGRTSQRNLPRSLCNRHARLLSRMVRANRWRAVSCRPEQHHGSTTRSRNRCQG
jgi:hypothetical protein